MKLFSLFRHFDRTKMLDNEVNKITGFQDYYLYLNYAYGYNKVLMTNPFCKKINFIEEGMDDYKNDNLLNYTVSSKNRKFRISMREKFIYCIQLVYSVLRGNTNERMQLIPVHPSCYSNIPDVDFFCLSNYAFPNVPLIKKNILNLNVLENSFNAHNLPRKSVVWIGDNVVNFYEVEVSRYISSIREGIKKFTKEVYIEKIYVKFHGMESKKSKKGTCLLFQELGFNVEIIDPNVSMEMLLMNSDDCVVLGLTSSLLWYASLMGHKAYSVSKYLPEVVHLSDENVYWEKVIRI